MKVKSYFAEAMQVRLNSSLKDLNTFGINVVAEHLVTLNSLADLASLNDFPDKKIIGGGSNILCTATLPGLTILNKIKGIELVKEDEDFVWLQVAAGEVWHDFVLYAIDKGLSGVENLALIPGTVGAAPIQNIGAYGVEVKSTIESVTFWHWQKNCFETLSNEACQFSYRDSIFKNELKGQIFVTSVCFKLSKKANNNTSYGAIEEALSAMNIEHASVRDIAQAVIQIRKSKLPDPKEIGNAGSFFKNPTISVQQFLELKKNHPAIPSYPINENLIKVPAGWLIEQCGWKGYRKNDTGVHARQALVLVNYGQASGAEIWALSSEIVASVLQKFGIELEREVQIW